jgi:hypothetical protein
MSWLSQQNYSLGLKASSATTAIANALSGATSVLYTSPPLPKGSYMVVVNRVIVPTALANSCSLGLFKGVTAIASSAFVAPCTFPTLSACVVSDGTNVVSVSATVATSDASAYAVSAGAIQIIQLTNV